MADKDLQKAHANKHNCTEPDTNAFPFEVGDVIIRSTFEGLHVKVKDLAIIRDDFDDETVISRVNARSAMSLLVTDPPPGSKPRLGP